MFGSFFTKYDKITGMNEIHSNVFKMPMSCAIMPISGKNIPTIPQLNPPINPEIMLLYCGIVFCAITIFIDTESIVINPISMNNKNDIEVDIFNMFINIRVSKNGTISEI